MERRIYRFANIDFISQVVNLIVPEEIVLDPHAPLGIIEDKFYVLDGVQKRELFVGLGLTPWPASPYPRYAISEFVDALERIDPALKPTTNDILFGWLDPVGFTQLNSSYTLFPARDQSNAPFHVASFPGLKVLTVGDTHHGLLTLKLALEYCQGEAWDVVLLCHQSAHIDWFRSVLGDDKVFLYHLQVSPSQLGIGNSRFVPLQDRGSQALVFHGQFSHLHPRRSAIHHALLASQGPDNYRHVARSTLSEWMANLADVASVMCTCLNNQISTYQIYSMLNGCLLFSDPFHDTNGWGKFFRHSDGFVAYESLEQLLELYSYYRSHPEAAATIAQRGRALVEEHFSLHPHSHPWLLADSVHSLRSGLAASTTQLESDQPSGLRWSKRGEMDEDLSTYQILQDLCVFFSRVCWVKSDLDSANLALAVVEQLPRCLMSAMLPSSASSEFLPIVMTRPPKLHELMALSGLGAACLLVLLRPDICSTDSQVRSSLDAMLTESNSLSHEWLGPLVPRDKLGILLRAPSTANAFWPLSPGWQALLVYPPNAFASITPMY